MDDDNDDAGMWSTMVKKEFLRCFRMQSGAYTIAQTHGQIEVPCDCKESLMTEFSVLWR